MAEDKTTGFSHITVGGDFDDDDVVIVAGSRAGSPAECALDDGPADGAEASLKPEASPSVGSEPVERQEAKEVEEPEPTTEPEDAPEPEPQAAEPETRGARKKDEYRETTLEDLESHPMPLTQKIVIAVAVVLIVLAVAWYFLH